VKATAYTTLVRPSIEYASAVWDPYIPKTRLCSLIPSSAELLDLLITTSMTGNLVQ
jgi:hypothetical protein